MTRSNYCTNHVVSQKSCKFTMKCDSLADNVSNTIAHLYRIIAANFPAPTVVSLVSYFLSVSTKMPSFRHCLRMTPPSAYKKSCKPWTTIWILQWICLALLEYGWRMNEGVIVASSCDVQSCSACWLFMWERKVEYPEGFCCSLIPHLSIHVVPRDVTRLRLLGLILAFEPRACIEN